MPKITDKATITYRLVIPKDKWKRYKNTVSRAKTMNTALIELVDAEIRRCEIEEEQKWT